MSTEKFLEECEKPKYMGDVTRSQARKLMKLVRLYRKALEFECGERCNQEHNPCNSREALTQGDKICEGEV